MAMTHAEAEQKANMLTKQIGDTINEQRQIFITCSTTQGKTFLRVVSANPMAEEKYVRGAFDKITKVALEILSRWKNDNSGGYAMNGQV